MDLSADGSLLVTGESAYGDNVQVWNATTGALVRTLAGHADLSAFYDVTAVNQLATQLQ